MSPQIKTVIPDGWRELKVGEMIIVGDYFNARTLHPSDEPCWIPYKKLVGEIFTGLTFNSIRRTRPDAPMDSNFASENAIHVPRNFSHSTPVLPNPVYPKNELVIQSTKSKVSDYLKKLKEKV